MIIKKILLVIGIDHSKIINNAVRSLLFKSILKASENQGLQELVDKLRVIVPDITHQYTTKKIEGKYWETKARTQQAFQMRLFEKALRMQNKQKMTIVDIGDSSGNHLIYINKLCKDQTLRTISVNLDKKSVEKISSRGMEAIHCAAEDLDLGDKPIDLFVSFQMVEHLMNPCLFFRRLAVKGKSDYLLVTVPYRQVSSVGLWSYRSLIQALQKNQPDLSKFLEMLPKEKYAEEEHIFELSPIDWKLLMLFSGWKPVYDEIYLQYPKKHPLCLTKPLWRKLDFEGFWGVILKKDLSFSNIYQDWRD